MENLNRELITALQNERTCREIFASLTQEEKDIYFIYLSYPFLVYSYLREKKDDKFIIDYLNSHNLEDKNIYTIFEMLNSLNDKSLIVKVVDLLPSEVIDHFRFVYMMKEIDNDDAKMAIINKIANKFAKTHILEDCINTLENDEYKTRYFGFLTLNSQVGLIQKFTNLEVKKQFAMKPEYSNFRSDLVASVEDEAFIIEVFDKIKVKKFRFNLIRKIENLILKEELIRRLGNKSLIDFVESFNEEETMIQIDTDIDEKISIGVELETCHKDIEVLKILKEMPYGFRIKRDGSVNSGFEIVSPILHNTTEEMSDLSSICQILQDNVFYTDSSCGGHIHLGADYLENVDEYKMLLHLYCNFEDIIYTICNRQHTKGRPTISRYASKTRKQYAKANKDGFFDIAYDSVESFREKLIELNDSRYKGLNVYNLKKYSINTIEFRMANGEIEFNELYHNIKLYARLLQVSKELANMKAGDPREGYLEALTLQLDEIEKLEIFLGLLFKKEEDRKFYRDRYKNNSSIFDTILSKLRGDNEVLEIVKPRVFALK